MEIFLQKEVMFEQSYRKKKSLLGKLWSGMEKEIYIYKGIDTWNSINNSGNCKWCFIVRVQMGNEV